MKKYKRALLLGQKYVNKASEQVAEVHTNTNHYWSENKCEIRSQGKRAFTIGHKYASCSLSSAVQTATGIYKGAKYTSAKLTQLQKNIENQGGYYRELSRRSTVSDSLIVGGETLGNLLKTGNIPDEIIQAYKAAYPELSDTVSFREKVLELDEVAMTGFISGVKGKLFEQKYVEYLNNDNLPVGYFAELAQSATQPGWDISIVGSNGQIASLLQAKATSSVSYVQDAIEKYPNIDVVTTDEVYSHLVMTGVSESVIRGNMSNTELEDALNNAVDASDLAIDYTLPIFALAFIAFTSYKEESLTLYEKAKHAGGRSGKTYLSYLIGGGIAAVTNTWWLGVLGSVSSRVLSDSGNTKYGVYETLKNVERVNQKIIDRLNAENA